MSSIKKFVTVTAAVSLSRFASALTTPLVAKSVTANAFDASGNTNMAVYWGQGPNQQRLSHFCADSSIDIIPIGFVNQFPDQTGSYPGTNFGNQCGSTYYKDANGKTSPLLNDCPNIGPDIKTCQQMGKKILLSLGGAYPTNQHLNSQKSATDFANFLWRAFGPNKEATGSTFPRPFGDAAVDGFDFDIENILAQGENKQDLYYGYSTMINTLRNSYATDTKARYISGAPQCIVPDAHLADAIQNSWFDFIFVQFYNTPQCSARAYFNNTYGAYGGPATDISYDSWISFVSKNSKNKNAKVFLGLPAGPTVPYDKKMYLEPSEAKQIIEHFQCKYPTQFGGVMIYEATYSENNAISGKPYADVLKGYLTGSTCAKKPTKASVKLSNVPILSGPLLGSIGPIGTAPFPIGPIGTAPYPIGTGTAPYPIGTGTAPYPIGTGTAPHSSSSRDPISFTVWAPPGSHAAPFPTGTGIVSHPSGTGTAPHSWSSGTAPFPTGTGIASQSSGTGTAPHSLSSGTAPFPTGTGVAPHPSGTGSAPYSASSGTAPFSKNSGTAVYPTRSGSASSSVRTITDPVLSTSFGTAPLSVKTGTAPTSTPTGSAATTSFTETMSDTYSTFSLTSVTASSSSTRIPYPFTNSSVVRTTLSSTSTELSSLTQTIESNTVTPVSESNSATLTTESGVETLSSVSSGVFLTTETYLSVTSSQVYTATESNTVTPVSESNSATVTTGSDVQTSPSVIGSSSQAYTTTEESTTTVYTTIYTTTCPVTETSTSNGSPVAHTTFTVSTVTETVTATVCPKCSAGHGQTPPAGATSVPATPMSTQDVVTTVIVYTTTTTCPVAHTVTSGPAVIVETTNSISTVVLTTTSTICTHCVPPPTSTPAPNMPGSSPGKPSNGSPAGGAKGPEQAQKSGSQGHAGAENPEEQTSSGKTNYQAAEQQSPPSHTPESSESPSNPAPAGSSSHVVQYMTLTIVPEPVTKTHLISNASPTAGIQSVPSPISNASPTAGVESISSPIPSPIHSATNATISVGSASASGPPGTAATSPLAFTGAAGRLSVWTSSVLVVALGVMMLV